MSTYAEYLDSLSASERVVAVAAVEAFRRDGQISGPIKITLEQAREIVENRSNGALSGISAGKCGRAWLDGEWCLDELEALCVMVRHEAGDNAQGAEDLIRIWNQPGE